MPQRRRWMAALLVLCGLQLSACSAVADVKGASSEPATLEAIDGSDGSLITLTAKAAERVDIKVEPVLAVGSGSVIPYSAVFYTATGDTWTYTNPQPLMFVRVPIVVDRIHGDRAFLSDGPPSGMEVVTQGAAELFGVETDVEE